MTTKERIVDEALTLFSRQGYKGTSVKNIADAVGIKDSSIYKHFKSKREIIDAIVDQMRRCMDQMSVDAGLPLEDNETAAAIYGRMTVEDLQQLSRKVFLFYLKDDFISRFWRLAVMEQYQNQEIYEIYRSIFFDQSIAYQTRLFAEMICQGIFREADPRVLAMSFYAPIYFLLSKYNGRTDNVEEALQALDMQVAEFCRIYTVQERSSHI